MEILSNKYSRWYDELIAKARSREPLTGYVEKHHVIPRCMGGDNSKSNLVKLTCREHFLAHWLLTKFTTGQIRHKLLHAVATMGRSCAGRVVTSWQYERARRAMAEARSGRRASDTTRAKLSAAATRRKFSDATRAKMARRMLGNNFRLGIPHTKEIKAKISEAGRGRQATDETRAKMSASRVGKGLGNKHNLGRKHSAETRAKMSAWQIGRKHSDETRRKIAAAATGRRVGDEVRAKMSASQVGRRHTEATRAKMSAWQVGRKCSDEERANMSTGQLRRQANKALQTTTGASA